MYEIAGVKQTILEATKEFASENGIASVDIRSVAKKCGVSVGTVYNHYPDKGALIAAVIEDFWQNAFKDFNFRKLYSLPNVDALEVFYLHLSEYLSTFKTNWLEQLSLLGATEKKTGRAKEQEFLSHITGFIEQMLLKSEAVCQNYSDTEIKKLSQFIFDNLMAMLRRGETDFAFARHLLGKILD